MADTRQKLSPLTVALHWIVGLTIVGLMAVGIYMADLPRSEFRSWLYGWHKVIGTTVFMIAAARILWRWKHGFPEYAARLPAWQAQAARLSHYLLLIATVGLPVTGAIYSWAGGHPVPILGLFSIQTETKYPLLYDTFHFIHGWAGWILAAIVAVHAAAALKHHFVDRDGTLKRMLGARIGPSAAPAHQELREETP